MKLSIITINFNNGAGLLRTIESVFSQTFSDYEFIIIDGGSSDESASHIAQHSDRIAYWVSEPDGGVFNAMNKGVKVSNGEYLLMLNSGDVLLNSQVLQDVFESVEEGNYKLIYGDVFRESEGKVFTESVFPDKLTMRFFRHGSISHQATFIHRDCHEMAGLYREDCLFSADRVLLMTLVCKYGVPSFHFNKAIAICNADGLTCQPSNFPAMDHEFKLMFRNYFPAFAEEYEVYERALIKKDLGYFWKKLKRVIKNIVGR